MSEQSPDSTTKKRRRSRIRRLSPGNLPPRTQSLLNQWAFSDGKESATSQMIHITLARVDANEELIAKKMAWYAEYYGLTLQELEQRLERDLAAGLRLPAIHSALEAETMGRGENLDDSEPTVEIDP